jgi:Tol biopolymer transport system component
VGAGRKVGRLRAPIVRGGSNPSFGPHGLTYLAPKGIIVGATILVRGSIDGADWSPNGKRLVFTRPTTKHVSGDALVLTDARGRHVCRLATGVNPVYPYLAWAPGGRRFAYLVADSNLYIAHADGSRRVLLTGASSNYQFAWSPDGRRIAYTSQAGSGPGRLVIANADGSKRARVATTDPGKTIAFAWSPDGRRLAYTS